MPHVLVSHNYHLSLDPREAALGRPYPPLQTLVAAAALRDAGHRVTLDDRTFAPGPDGFGALLDRVRPDRVVVVGDDHGVPMKQCLAAMRRAGQAMVGAAAARGIPTLVSGPDVSDHPQVYLQAGAAAAVSGEVQAVLIGWLDDQPGLVGLHGASGAGGRAGPLSDLGGLPRPAWELLDLAPYRQAWRRAGAPWELPLSTARGCPYRCAWCAKPTWGRSYAVRPPEQVAADILDLQGRFSPGRLWMTDDIFALRPRWLRELRRALESTRGGAPVLPYRCLSRVDLLVDPAFTADLAATGCREVWVGAESGDDGVLRAMDKDCTVREVEAATALLRRHGIQVGFFLQLGYPGEGLAQVQATVDMVRRLAPDQIGVSVSYPLPGTPFFDRVAPSMRATSWEASMDNRPLFEAPFDQPFYDAAKRLIQHQHAAALGPQALRALLHRPGRGTARRAAAAVAHTVALPLARRRLVRAAVPNPRAVPLAPAEPDAAG